jgi:hypothetical protein
MRDYAADLEPHILNILHASFGAKWGDAEYWRWKHATRPGFSPSDVVVCAAADKPIACFHLAVRTMRLAPGLDVCCSIEGDFAIEPEARGTGIPQKAYRYVSPRLVSRAVLVRAGFSSRDLYEHVYKPKFGHRMPPTVTAQYRKILSDRALHAKLQEFGNAFRVRPWGQRLLRLPLTVRMEVEGFQPCDLVLTETAASCAPAGMDRPDLKVKMPYILLTAARMSPFQAVGAVLKATFSGRVRSAGLTRVMFRGLRARV